MSYFLCYELEKVKKEEVDFWTSRHERVKCQFKSRLVHMVSNSRLIFFKLTFWAGLRMILKGSGVPLWLMTMQRP